MFCCSAAGLSELFADLCANSFLCILYVGLHYYKYIFHSSLSLSLSLPDKDNLVIYFKLLLSVLALKKEKI